jgi:hypothetical protein
MKNGGSAFPYRYEIDEHQLGGLYKRMVYHDEGMTLRDYFAGQTLQGLIANFAAHEMVMPNDVAMIAYRIADAMIAERG